MKRSIERRKHITRQLDSIALPWRFWDAVDGKELILETIAHRNQTHWWRVHRGRIMNQGEIGCYLSHYGVWKHIVREECPVSIVLEDDAVLQNNFETIIRALVDFHCQWDIVLLSPKRNYKNTSTWDKLETPSIALSDSIAELEEPSPIALPAKQRKHSSNTPNRSALPLIGLMPNGGETV